MTGKRLSIQNGDVVDDPAQTCPGCPTADLPPGYNYCPWCGAEL